MMCVMFVFKSDPVTECVYSTVCICFAQLLSEEWRVSGLHWRRPWAEGIPGR